MEAENSEALRTAKLLDIALDEIGRRLEDHLANGRRKAQGLMPANGLLCRGAGRAESIQSQISKLGLATQVVSDERTVHGLARLCGFGSTLVEKDSDEQEHVAKLVRAAREKFESCDLLILHYKTPDLEAHDRRPRGKVAAIEALDSALSPLIQLAGTIAVTGDHSTLCATGAHSADPVPALIYSKEDRTSGEQLSIQIPGGSAPSSLETPRFCESACARGSLGRMTSASFLNSILNILETGFRSIKEI